MANIAISIAVIPMDVGRITDAAAFANVVIERMRVLIACAELEPIRQPLLDRDEATVEVGRCSGVNRVNSAKGWIRPASCSFVDGTTVGKKCTGRREINVGIIEAVPERRKLVSNRELEVLAEIALHLEVRLLLICVAKVLIEGGNAGRNLI